MSRLRVVLDTNVLVSGIAYPASVPGNIVFTWRQGGLDVVLSHYILDEMVRVLPRLTRLRMSSQEIRDLADCLMFMADIVEPLESRDPQLRDEKDQPVLQTFLASTTEFLITGDKDLLALRDQSRIITPAEFWASHGG